METKKLSHIATPCKYYHNMLICVNNIDPLFRNVAMLTNSFRNLFF